MIITNTELYNQNVAHYFETQLGNDILRLQGVERDRFFQMLTDYADVWVTLLPFEIPLISHILGKEWNRDGMIAGAEEMIRQYEQWKNVR